MSCDDKSKNNCIFKKLTGRFNPRLPSRSQILIFLSVVLIGALLDLYTKSAAFEYMKNYGYWPKTVIEGFFNLVARENSGAAWSSFEGRRIFLVSVSAVALVVVLVIFFTGQVKTRIGFWAVSLFGAGIIGNIYDRIFNDGRVRDFLDFYVNINGKEHHWPAFNLADSYLCIAVGLMLISSFISTGKNKTQN